MYFLIIQLARLVIIKVLPTSFSFKQQHQQYKHTLYSPAIVAQIPHLLRGSQIYLVARVNHLVGWSHFGRAYKPTGNFITVQLQKKGNMFQLIGTGHLLLRDIRCVHNFPHILRQVVMLFVLKDAVKSVSDGENPLKINRQVKKCLEFVISLYSIVIHLLITFVQVHCQYIQFLFIFDAAQIMIKLNICLFLGGRF